MIDPEITYYRVGMCQCEAIRCEPVREESWIEIETETVRFRPIDPTLEVGGLDLVPLYRPAAVIQVTRVEIQPVPSGDKRERHLNVFPQLIDGASLTWVVAGGLNAPARQSGVRRLESAHIVSLPAVQGDWNGAERSQHSVHIHAELGIPVPSGFERFSDESVFSHENSF